MSNQNDLLMGLKELMEAQTKSLSESLSNAVENAFTKMRGELNEINNISNLSSTNKDTGMNILTEKESEDQIEQSGVQPINPNLSLHENAIIAQGKDPFDPKNPYDTLVNPFDRSKKELCDFADTALGLYESDSFPKVYEAFQEDFFYWNEQHLSLLPAKICHSLRNLLEKENVKIRKLPGLRVSKAISELLETARKDSSEQKSECETYHRQAPQQNASEKSGEGNLNIIGQQSKLYQKHYDKSVGRPSEVSKLFPSNMRYTGSPKEPIRRRYSNFLDACHLCQIDTDNTDLMLKIIPISFLSEQALIFFTDNVKNIAKSPQEAIEMLEKHFLGQRAKRVNDETWEELSYKFVRQKLEYEKKNANHESCLNFLITQITELADIRTGPGNNTTVFAKIISATRDEPTFKEICLNPPEDIQSLNAALRSRALEADRDMIRTASANKSKPGNLADLAYFVDRRLQVNSAAAHKHNYKIKGYGKPLEEKYRGGRTQNRIPWDVCIICGKKDVIPKITLNEIRDS